MKTVVAVAVIWASLLCGPGSGAQDSGSLRIYWIDVEGGAATLVVTPQGGSLLMDCGWPGTRDAERIASTAKQAGLARIDHYLTSHFHTDHWGCVTELSELIPIEKFYYHAFPEGAKDVDPKLKEAFLRVSHGKSVIVEAGQEIPLKGSQVRLVSANGLGPGEPAGSPQIRRCEANPEHPAKPEDLSDNARSLGFVLSFEGFRFVDLGDLTWNVEHKLVCPVNLIGTADVFQVSHHGLDQSNSPALLRAVSPTVAIMNNGAKKGGSPATFKVLKQVPGLRDIFQLHRNVETGPEDNAPPEFVANDDAKCEGNGIVLTLDPRAKSYSVEVGGKKTRRTYSLK